MNLFEDMFKGFFIISIYSLNNHGLTVKDMAKKAAKAHQKGLSSFGKYLEC